MLIAGPQMLHATCSANRHPQAAGCDPAASTQLYPRANSRHISYDLPKALPAAGVRTRRTCMAATHGCAACACRNTYSQLRQEEGSHCISVVLCVPAGVFPSTCSCWHSRGSGAGRGLVGRRGHGSTRRLQKSGGRVRVCLHPPPPSAVRRGSKSKFWKTYTPVWVAPVKPK